MPPNFQIFSSLRYDPALLSLPDTAPPSTSYNHAHPSPLYMLDLHRDRLLRAAAHWLWMPAVRLLFDDPGLDSLASAIHQEVAKDPTPSQWPLRVRVAISHDGTMDITTSPVPPTSLENLFPSHLPAPESPSNGYPPPAPPPSPGTPIKAPPYEVVPAPTPTRRSEFTHYKTTVREVYDTARERADITPTSRREVLIVNEADGSIMEGSTTTPYFWREGGWVTPSVSRKFTKVDGSGGQDGTTRRWALQRGLVTEAVIPVDSLVDGEECWLSNGVRGFFFGRIRLQ